MSFAADRMRRLRSRQASGRACLMVEVDIQELSAALIEGEFLDERHCDDQAEIARALERALAVLIKVTRHWPPAPSGC